jgi:hypothetical protein
MEEIKQKKSDSSDFSVGGSQFSDPFSK